MKASWQDLGVTGATMFTCGENNRTLRSRLRLSINGLMLFQVAIGLSFLIYIYADWKVFTVMAILGAVLAQYDIRDTMKTMTERQASPILAGSIFRLYSGLVMMSGLCLIAFLPALAIGLTAGPDVAYLILKMVGIASVILGIYAPLYGLVVRKWGMVHVLMIIRLVMWH